ncbi:DMT family transporter [Cocleimonas sp. KMM 6892]|uniref:DMT family transporter n=1 Tax=unclassified Cocleimonas TaxID=2639732 RepID=UPI002DB8C7DB|nr:MULTISPECIES: DMT family transporter [unclassified Cocleimonas]MEB8431964.1 DMT family transporter [Cocleimonas sp. KMM 6892]MEC4714950.1 DMT family transporter [Cocleimonas sp. KMM 6895]MEC4744236.1 DMT family transporter [Cocleimonas sp. KMM 6896]
MKLSNSVKAMLWMLGAVMSFTSMAIAGREMAVELDTFEIMLYRSMIGLIIVIIIARFTGTLSTITRKRFRLHFIRNVSHFIGQNLWFYAVAIIPFAQVFAFEFSTPIWVALLAPIFLAERLTKIRLLTVVIGFVGILIVAQPGSIVISSGVIAAALCAVAFAGAYIGTKLLSKTESISCIMFWLTAIQLALGIVCAAYDGDVAMPSLATLPLIVLVACAGLFAHFCITSALKLAPVMFVSPIDFLRLPIIALIGASFYNEAINAWVIVGAIIVFGSNLLNIWGENRAKVVS